MPVFFCIINRSLFVAFLLTAIIFLSATVMAAEEQLLTKDIEVIGTAPIYKDDVATARELAISNSLVSAADMAVVELLPLESLVQKFETLNEALYVNTGKFVQSYKVLTESRFGNKYRVIVQVTVSINNLKEQLSMAGFMLEKKTLPTILFCIAEQNLEDLSPQYWWGNDFTFFKLVGESAMTKTMEKNGLSVVYNEGLDPNVDIKSKNYKSGLGPDLSNEEAVNLGIHWQADVVIVGKSIVQKAPNIMETNRRSFKGTVIARALRTATGEEIAATTQTAVALNADEMAGSYDALSSAGSLAGQELALQIISAWQKGVKKPTTIEIIIEGTGYLSNFVIFRKIINDMIGVMGLQTKEMKFDEAIISVDFQGNAKDLADALMLNTYKTFGINIYEVSPARLRIELIPKQAPSSN